MATKDVRVRLSAEGQAEVIAAFRRVQEETDKANKSAKSAAQQGFKDLKEAAHSLALEYLALESAMKVFEVMKTAVETSIQYATGIEKAAEKTGFAAQTLQVFGVAAQRVGIDQEVVTKGLIKFQKSMYDLELGTTKTANAIRELFGNKDALKGLPDEARLQKVTEALAKMEPGAKRTGIAMALFGKAGAELLPVLDSLGAEGFDKLKGKLEEYGLALDAEGIQRARQAEASLADVQLAAKGVQMQFTQGLLPALSDVSEGLAKIGPAGWRGFGEAAGSALKGVILFIGSLSIQLRELFDKIVAVAHGLYELTPAALAARVAEKGGIKAALGSVIDTIKGDWQEANHNSELALVQLGNIVADGTASIEKKVNQKGGSAADIAGGAAVNRARESLLKAREEFTRAALRDELDIYKENAKLGEAVEKERYDAGLESIKDYFAGRRKIQQDENQKEIAALEAQRDALAGKKVTGTGDRGKAEELGIQRELLDVQTKIQILKTKDAADGLRNAHEEGAAQRANATEVLGFEEKILIAQGKRHEAEALKIDAEVAKYAEALRKEGKIAEDQIKAQTATFRNVLATENDFAELKRTLEAGLAELAAARTRAEELATSGAISHIELQRRLKALDEERLPALRAIVAAMQAIATASQNPELAKEYADGTKQINEAAKALEHLKGSNQAAIDTFDKGLGRSVNNFLTTGITHAKSLGEAVRGMAMSVTQDVQKLFLTLIENIIKAKLLAKLNNSNMDQTSGVGGFLTGLLGSAPGKAGGGPIYGPGGTDNVPTWLTHGEFVVKEPVVRQPGMMSLLTAINNGLGTPTLKSGGFGFAAGGIVEAGFTTTGRDTSPEAKMTVGLDYGLVLKQLSAHPDFGRVIVKHLDMNRKAASAALGVRQT